MNRRRSLLLALVALTLAVAACSSDNRVGSDELLEGTGSGEGNLSLGSTTTTAPPADDSAATTAPPTTAAPATTAPPQTTTTAPQDRAAIEIQIRSDDVSPQMNPSVARVFAGSVVRWVNTDSVERSVQASDGSFYSGPIAPGGTWEHAFPDAGTYDYRDGTRPYVTARVEVLAQ